MPVTLQKRIWVDGRTNLSHLGKITIFFLIFNTHNLTCTVAVTLYTIPM